MVMSKAYFKNLRGIGSLYLLESYFKYECDDIVFSCRDTKNLLYFGVLVSLSNDSAEWCIFRTTQQLLDTFRHRRITPLCMANCVDSRVYEVTQDAHGISTAEVSIWNSKLQSSGIARSFLP